MISAHLLPQRRRSCSGCILDGLAILPGTRLKLFLDRRAEKVEVLIVIHSALSLHPHWHLENQYKKKLR